MSSKIKSYEWLAGVALVCIAIFFWYKNYFIQDDAYIAFVYAKNFAHGYGLVWYPGLDEYGYTNFLYTLVVGTVMFWVPGVDPEYISASINFISYLAALTLTYLLSFRLSGSKLAAACAVLILATHHTFSAYASGGLETMTVTALVIGFYYILFSYHSSLSSRHYPLAILASAALLTRLDSAILLFPSYVYLLYRQCEEHFATKQSSFSALTAAMTNKTLRLAAGIPTLCVLALLGWAKLYYGYALPNTFYAKIPGDTSMVWLGQRYILKYLELHHYIPAVLLGLSLIILLFKSFSLLKCARQGVNTPAQLAGSIPQPLSSDSSNHYLIAPLFTLVATLFIWLGYVVYVGGCFMEFRLLVPILPIFAVVVFVALVKGNFRNIKFILLLIAPFLVFGNIHHGLKFKTDANKLQFVDMENNRVSRGRTAVIEPISGNSQWLTIPANANWRKIGIALHRIFAEEKSNELVIATINPGAIAFYSNLFIIDTVGLNTRYAILNSKPFASRPGHSQIAKNHVYDDLSVNLSIATPQTLCRKGKTYVWSPSPVRAFVSAPIKRTIMIPIGSDCFLVADYRIPNRFIENLISKGIILDFRKNRDIFDCPKWLCL
jgi:hypothetical protein